MTSSSSGGNAIAHSLKRRIVLILRELLALITWGYVASKLFVFDVDVWLIQATAPDFEYVLRYKILAFLALLAVILVTVRSWRALWFVTFVLIYPWIIIFVRIPIFVFRRQSWELAVNAAHFLAQFLISIRYNVTIGAIYTSCAAIALVAMNQVLLEGSVIGLVGCLLAAMYRRAKVAMSGDRVVRSYVKAVEWLRLKTEPHLKPDAEFASLAIASLNEKQLESYRNSLDAAVLYNRGCLFLARRVKDFNDSTFMTFWRIVSALGLWMEIIITFMFVYVALSKIDATSFRFVTEPSLFQFFRFSFYASYNASISEIVATGAVSQSMNVFETMLSTEALVVFVGLLISARAQRTALDVNGLVKAFENAAQNGEALVRENFRHPTIDDALRELERLQSGLVKVLLYMTQLTK